jgi:hypothetical protein
MLSLLGTPEQVAGGLGAAVVTAVPRQRTGSFGERMMIPLLHLSYVAWLPMPLVYRTRDPRVLDGIITQTLSNTPAFFSSTTILIMGGLLALMGTTDKAAELDVAVQAAFWFWQSKGIAAPAREVSGSSPACGRRWQINRRGICQDARRGSWRSRFE